MRVVGFTQGRNDERMVRNLDALEERRDMVSVWLADYQQKLAQRYNRKVRPREFMLGHLVLRKAVGSMKDQHAGKLAPAMAEAGAYYLEDLEERPLP